MRNSEPPSVSVTAACRLKARQLSRREPPSLILAVLFVYVYVMHCCSPSSSPGQRLPVPCCDALLPSFFSPVPHFLLSFPLSAFKQQKTIANAPPKLMRIRIFLFMCFSAEDQRKNTTARVYSSPPQEMRASRWLPVHHVTCLQVRNMVDSIRAGHENLAKSGAGGSGDGYGGRGPPRWYLIDVRSLQEVHKYGSIPTALHMPLPTVQDVLLVNGGVDDAVFRDTYGVPKPSPDAHTLVFFCQAGVRSAKAADIAESLGYTSVANFGGSFLEWQGTYPDDVERVPLIPSSK